MSKRPENGRKVPCVSKDEDRYAQQVAHELRAQKIYRMRIDGYSLFEIADEVGVTPQMVSATLKTTMAELKSLTAQEADAYRQYELTRLDKLLLALKPKIDEGDVPAIMAGVRVIERRCKMLGIDAPQEIKVDDGGELREKLLAMLGD